MAQLYSQDLYGSETYSETTTDVAAGAGTYNEIYYNENVYNAAILVLALFESLTSTDLKINDPAVVKTELLTMVDVLQKFFGGQILTETMSMSDAQLKTYFANKLDIMALTDVRTATVGKNLLETMTATDIRNMFLSHPLGDFVLMVDDLTKQITDKRLLDSVRLHDWLSTRKNPAQGIWSN